MFTVADLFTGMGGFSLAATMAGGNVIWVGNHKQAAVDTHKRNHPHAVHVCQDLGLQDWTKVPRMDLLVASWCCQGHSPARGKDRPHHDASRATADAFVNCLEICRPEVALGENVPEFMSWVRYPAWVAAINALGYSVSVHISDAADHGVPQNRVRAFFVLTKSKNPVRLKVPKREHVPASSFVDFEAGNWSRIDRPGRAASTLLRVANGRKAHGARFLTPYYGSGSGTTGRCLARPIGTIPTRDRWAVIDGDRMRMLTVEETRDAMGFPKSYLLPSNRKLAVEMLGNAVAPQQACDYINALRAAV